MVIRECATSKGSRVFTFERNVVPMFMRVSGQDNFHATTFSHADYILVDKLDFQSFTGPVSLDFFGVCAAGYSVTAADQTWLYYKVDQYIVTWHKAALASLSRYFVDITDMHYYDDPTSLEVVFSEGVKKTVPTWTWQGLMDADKSKVSSQHHFHFSPLEAYAAAPVETRDRLSEVLYLPEDANYAMVAGIIMWVSALSDNLWAYIKNSAILHATSQADFAKRAKRISILAKSMQNLTALDLRQVFEVDVLVNRVAGQLDWGKEKDNRQNPNTADFSYDYIFEKASRVFMDAAARGKRPIRMHWDDFWESRWQWSAAGSVHSQYAVDMDYVPKERQLKNKFICLSSMPKVNLEFFAGREATLHAWSSIKYEWGKLRAIYGTDLTGYVLAHHGFYNCEDVLPTQFPVGKAANERNVASRVAGVLAGQLPYCVDYEDFNSQHSVSSMQAVIRAYMVVFQKHLTESQLMACDWTSRSLDNVWIHDNLGTASTYKAHGTLLSGWRLTTFMNSVLNWIYTRAICAETLDSSSSLHNGDDVLIGTNNLNTAKVSMQLAKVYNVRLQPSKCAFAGIAEFLRVDHTRGSKGQYLTRACATVVHSRIESKMSTDIRDLIESMEMRFADLLHRGLSIKHISALRTLYYKHQALICETTVASCFRIKLAHRVVGGVSDDPSADIDVLIKPSRNTQQDIALPQLPAIQSYAEALVRKLDRIIPYSKTVDRITSATLNAVLEKARTMEIVPNTDNWYEVMRSLYKAHRGSLTTPNFGKALLVGFLFEVLQAEAPSALLTSFLSCAKRPMEALPLVV